MIRNFKQKLNYEGRHLLVSEPSQNIVTTRS